MMTTKTSVKSAKPLVVAPPEQVIAESVVLVVRYQGMLLHYGQQDTKEYKEVSAWLNVYFATHPEAK